MNDQDTTEFSVTFFCFPQTFEEPWTICLFARLLLSGIKIPNAGLFISDCIEFLFRPLLALRARLASFPRTYLPSQSLDIDKLWLRIVNFAPIEPSMVIW